MITGEVAAAVIHLASHHSFNSNSGNYANKYIAQWHCFAMA